MTMLPPKQAPRAFGPSRRTFIKTGLLGTAGLVVLGGLLSARQTVLRQTPKQGLKVLTAAEYAVMSAIAARMIPPAGEGAPGALALDLPATLDAFVASGPAWLQKDFKALLWVVENALVGALMLERVTPFTQLSPDAQDRALEAMRASHVPLRKAMFYALKGLCASMYYADDRTWARMGYSGPPPKAMLRSAFSANLVDYDSLRPKKG
jgi:hypothetical protein